MNKVRDEYIILDFFISIGFFHHYVIQFWLGNNCFGFEGCQNFLKNCIAMLSFVMVLASSPTVDKGWLEIKLYCKLM